MMNNAQFAQFRKEAEQSLQALAEKHKVNIKAGSIKYTSDSFTLQLEVAKKEVNGMSREQAEFEKYCGLYDIPKEAYRQKFTSNGNDFVLTGFNLRAPKYPFQATSLTDGKSYKFTESIKRHFTAVPSTK